MPSDKKTIYLTFDDGPHPEITNFVLDTLKNHQAKASFFCIGDNVKKFPETFHRIIDEGHAIGNHTFNHLNGWKTSDELYLDNIAEASEWIDSTMFRPPYGRITRFQLSQLQKPRFQMKTIMWSVLSGDFDQKIAGEKCYQNVIRNSGNGAIVVFHDSEKAAVRMQYALPKVLKHFADLGFTFEKLPYQSQSQAI
jgi:peptidoglycan/xylan/chitin deacetylase (PgdA/CDA1 family)